MILDDGSCMEDDIVKVRIAVAKDAFNKRKELLTKNPSNGL
jgi:hypothetical protein